MYFTFSIRQRLVAQILLLSLFLQSCLNQPIPPVVTKSSKPIIDGSSSRKHMNPTSSLALPANITSPLLLDNEPEVPENQLDGEFSVNSVSINSIQTSDTASNQPIVNNYNSTGSFDKQKAIKTNKSKRSANSPIAEKNSINTNKKLLANQDLAKAQREAKKPEKEEKTYESEPFEPDETSFIRSERTTSGNSDLINKIASKIFTAKGGHTVTFDWENGQCIANVEEILSGGIRKNQLPVYLLPGMTWEQLASINKIEQPYRIKEVWRGNGQKGYLLVGKRGLMGGGKTPLHEAVEQEDISSVKQLITEGADVTIKDDNGDTPLQMAIRRNKPEIIKQLISLRGPALNISNDRGYTPLHEVVLEDNPEIVKQLVAAGADLHLKNNAGLTPIDLVSITGYFKYIQEIFNIAGTNINSIGNDGLSHLHRAIQRRDLPLIKELISSKADLNLKNSSGNTPLHLAVEQEDTHIIQHLLALGANKHITDNNGTTPAQLALQKYNRAQRKQLLSALRANINEKDNDGYTPLHRAVLNKDVALTKQLLTTDARINEQDKNGNTPLHIAAMQGNTDIVRMLVQFGVDIKECIEIRNNTGKTPFHYAAIGGYTEIVQLLMDTGLRKRPLFKLFSVNPFEKREAVATINIQDRQGCTALHDAAEQGHIEIVTLLLKAEADLYIKDKDGLTALHKAFEAKQMGVVQAILKQENLFPLHWATENGDLNLTKQLLAAGAATNRLDRLNRHALCISYEQGHEEIAKQLLEAGVDVNAQYTLSNLKEKPRITTLLGLAISNGYYKAAKRLLAAGTDITFRDDEGQTYLHLAVEKQQLHLIKDLINAGAELNAKDKQGNTPLHLAAYRCHPRIVTQLLEAGANLQVTDNNGYTPLLHAMHVGRLKIVEILSTATMRRFYASRCRWVVRARKRIILLQKQPISEKLAKDSSPNIIQDFLNDYPTNLSPADSYEFNTTIAPILQKKLIQVPYPLQEQVIHYFRQGGAFYPKVLQEYDVQDWIKESLILDIIKSADEEGNKIAAHQFREQVKTITKNYSDEETNNFLYALQEKQIDDQLDLLSLCELITCLTAATSRQAIEWLIMVHDGWPGTLLLAWISKQIKSLKQFLPSQHRKITHALVQLPWGITLMDTFLAGLHREKNWNNIKKFFSFITLNIVPEHILMPIFNQGPLKTEESIVKSWQYYIFSKSLKFRLKKLFLNPIPLIESQLDTLLLNKLWLHDIIDEALVELEQKQAAYTDIDAQRFSQVLDLLVEYNIKQKKTYKDVFTVISTKPSQEWEKEIHQLVIAATFEDSRERRVKEIIDYIVEKSPYASFANQKDSLETAYQGVQDAYKTTSKLLTTNDKPISTWQQEDIQRWAIHIKSSTTIDFTHANTQYELVAVVKRAAKLQYDYELRDTQLLSTLIFLNPAERKGRLAQVNTGEGKSLIVAMLAAIHALQRKKVDIVTTSTELSKREADKQQGFFNMLGLTVGENSNDELNWGIYGRDIVYGTAADFQRDILLTEFFSKGIRGTRKFEVVIVDEVDSMLFDSRNYNLKISTQMPAMHHLEVILGALFNFVDLILRHLLEKDGKTYYIAENFEIKGDQIIIHSDKPVRLEDSEIEDKETFIVEAAQRYLNALLRDPTTTKEATEWHNYTQWNAKLVILKYKAAREQKEKKRKALEDRCKGLEEKLQNSPYEKGEDRIIEVPRHLREFALKQIPHWTRSALLAICFYKRELHYDVKNGEIVPIDYNNTGVLQENMVWNDGLAQMLQIKEGLKVKPESIATNFITTSGFFKRYGHGIYGLTGTLGNQPTHDFLSEIYGTDLVIIPPYKQIKVTNNEGSQYLCKELPAIIVPTQQEWQDAICKTVLSQVRNQRAVLIICKYIDQVKRLEEWLKVHHDSHKIFTYTGQEKFDKKDIDAGEIIIATNIAGRGTDIITSEKVENHGGMHVCITFLPDTYRVELQNAGRTARQGKKGSAQLIIQHPTINDIKVSRILRDLQESNAINRAKQDVEEMHFQDQLFNDFCALESGLLPNVDNAKKIKQYQILEESWKVTEKEFLSPSSLARAYQAQLDFRVRDSLDFIINKLENDLSKIPEIQWGQSQFSLELNGKKLKISDIQSRADIERLKEDLKPYIRKNISTTEFKEETANQQHITDIQHNFCEGFKSSMSADVIEAFRTGKPFVPQNYGLAAKYKWGEQERRAVEERWGLWLHHALREKRTDKQAVQEKFKTLATQISNHAEDNDLIQNPYFYVQKGNELLAEKLPYLAIDAYDKAISLDSLYSVNARYNKVLALLQPTENKQNLRSARKDLKQAKILLTNKHQFDLMLFYSLVGSAIGAKPTLLQHMRHQLDILVEQQKYIDAALHQLYIAKEKNWNIEVKEVKTLAEIFQDAAEDHKEAIEKAALHGLTHLYTIEAKEPYPWKAILCLVFLGVVQIAAGMAIALCTYGTGANVAAALIGEGISDIIAAGKALITGHFDWKEWGIQKVISMLSSMAVVGLNSISKGFKKAWEAINNIGTLNTGIGDANFKALSKQVAVGLAKGATKELINYGLEELSNDCLKGSIQESIENSITEKLEQLISNNYWMRKALELDVAQKNSHWKAILIREGLAILSRPNHPFVKFLKDLGKSICDKAAAKVAEYLQKNGKSSLEATGFRWVCKIPFIGDSIIKILSMTDRFFTEFSDTIESKYKEEIEKATVAHTKQGEESAQKSRQEHIFRSATPPEVPFESRNINIPRTEKGAEYSSESYKNFTPLYEGGYDVAGSPKFRIARTFGQDITTKITSEIQGGLINPVIREVNSAFVEKMAEKITASTNAAVQSLRKQGKTHYLGNKMADNSDEHVGGELPKLENLPPAIQEKIKALQAGEPCDMTDLPLFAKCLKRPIYIMDKKTKRVFDIFGKKLKGEPIFLQYDPAGQGHWTPASSAAQVEESGKNNCQLDAIFAQLSVEERQKLGAKSGNDLRKIQINTILRNPKSMATFLQKAKIMDSYNSAYRMTGGTSPSIQSTYNKKEVEKSIKRHRNFDWTRHCTKDEEHLRKAVDKCYKQCGPYYSTATGKKFTKEEFYELVKVGPCFCINCREKSPSSSTSTANDTSKRHSSEPHSSMPSFMHSTAGGFSNASHTEQFIHNMPASIEACIKQAREIAKKQAMERMLKEQQQREFEEKIKEEVEAEETRREKTKRKSQEKSKQKGTKGKSNVEEEPKQEQETKVDKEGIKEETQEHTCQKEADDKEKAEVKAKKQEETVEAEKQEHRRAKIRKGKEKEPLKEEEPTTVPPVEKNLLQLVDEAFNNFVNTFQHLTPEQEAIQNYSQRANSLLEKLQQEGLTNELETDIHGLLLKLHEKAREEFREHEVAHQIKNVLSGQGASEVENNQVKQVFQQHRQNLKRIGELINKLEDGLRNAEIETTAEEAEEKISLEEEFNINEESEIEELNIDEETEEEIFITLENAPDEVAAYLEGVKEANFSPEQQKARGKVLLKQVEALKKQEKTIYRLYHRLIIYSDMSEEGTSWLLDDAQTHKVQADELRKLRSQLKAACKFSQEELATSRVKVKQKGDGGYETDSSDDEADLGRADIAFRKGAMKGVGQAIKKAPVEFLKGFADLLQNPVTTVKGLVAALKQLPQLPGALAAYMETIEGNEEAKGEEIAEAIVGQILNFASPNKVKLLMQLGKMKKLGKALRIVASEAEQVEKVGKGIEKSKLLKNKKNIIKKELPSLDATGKVHGILPKVEDLSKYSKFELQTLLKELKQSVQRRIEVTARIGRDRAHGQRQAAEQVLIKAIEKHLQDQ